MTDYDSIYEDILNRSGGPYIRLLTLLPGKRPNTTGGGFYEEPEDDDDYNTDDEEPEGQANANISRELVFPKSDSRKPKPDQDPVFTNLEVQLAAHPLRECPVYEALSYTWGDDGGQRYVMACNEHRFLGLRNLANALLALRLPDRPRTLWIDAICINQNNDPRARDERSVQVAMMQHIYRKAEQAVVWLGTATESNFAPLFRDNLPASRSLRRPNMQMILGEFVSSLEELLAFTIEVLATDPGKLWRDRSEVASKWEGRQTLVKNSAQRALGDWDCRTDGDPRELDLETVIRETMPENMPRWARAASRKVLMRPKNRSTLLETMAEWGGWRLALPNILCREWWSRKWIIQEACLASEVVFICGDITFGLDLLFLGLVLFSIFSDKPQFRGHVPPSWSLMEVVEYRTLYQKHGEGPLPSFLHLLQEFRSSDAKNPVDHVYALMGLVAADELDALHRNNCRPDYSIGMTVSRCYTETARAICTNSNNLDILVFVHQPAQRTASLHGNLLPSWVPDWAVKAVDKLYPMHAIDSSGPASPKALFSACGTCLNWAPVFKGKHVFVLSGYVADSIADVVSEAMPSLTDTLARLVDTEDMIDEMIENEYGALGGLIEIGSRLGKFFGIFIEWEHFALERAEPYPTGEDIRRVFCAVRCYGHTPEGFEVAFQAFNEYMDAFSNIRRVYNLAIRQKMPSFPFHSTRAPEGKPEPSKIRQALVAVASFNKRKKAKMQRFSALQGLTVGRKLAWTRRGFLALVPEETTAGDQIVLCKGSKLPLVLRPMEEHKQWVLLEPCYVHGIMHGEAWDEGLCEDIELV